MKNLILIVCILLSTHAFADKRVVVISWDGLRPDFLTSEKYKTPNTRKLMSEGSYSLDLEPVNPTLTYPNHTTMVTGVPSSVHGILSNTVFDSKKGPLAFWYWESDKVKVTPIWKLAFDAGKKTSIFGWPATVGAKATWSFPEIFTVAGMNKTNEELIRAESGADALKEIETALKEKIPTDNELAHDKWVAKAAAYLETKYRPDLQLVHLVNGDHWQHETGKFSRETMEAVEEVDREIGEIVSTVKDACIIVLGDHGHADYKSVTNINVILKRHKLLDWNDKKELISYKAIAHTSGSQAAIYVKHKNDLNAVSKILKDELKDNFFVLNKKEFKKLNIYPEADFVVISKIGHAISGGFKDTEVDAQASPKATHGYLASDAEMKTVFIASGCGISKKDLGKMSMLDVAPTIADLINVKLTSTKRKSVLKN